MGRKRKNFEERSHVTEAEDDWKLETPLAILLLQKFCWGNLSAAEVQLFADTAMKSRAKGKDLACLAKLGGHGFSKNNCHRDLCRNFFSGTKTTPTPTQIETTMNVKDSHGAIVTAKKAVPMVLPHHWVQSLEENNLLETLTCSQEALQKFWKMQDWKKNPQLQCWRKFWQKLDLSTPGTLPIPWLLHGDGAPFSEVDSLTCISMRCAISSMPIKESQLLLGCIAKSAKDANSMKPLWEAIAKSFEQLAHGKLQNGQGIRKGILFVISGDLEWFAQEFGWPTAGSNKCCPYCQADNFFELDKSIHPFTDFRRDASWKGTCRKWGEAPPKENPLYTTPGVSFWTIKMDLLHCMDLGIAAHVFGNLLAICLAKLPGSKKVALVELNKTIAKQYQELGVPAQKRIPRLNLTDFESDEYPVLKHVKGRRIRAFAPVATLLATKEATDNRGKQMLALCKALQRIYDLCDREEHIWESSTSKEFAKQTEALLAHYAYLAKDSMKRGTCQWSIVQKHHLFAHFPAQCQFLAPRSCWAYGGESFMSLAASIAAKSVQSTPSWMLPSKVIEKFEFAFHLTLKGLWNPDWEEED